MIGKVYENGRVVQKQGEKLTKRRPTLEDPSGTYFREPKNRFIYTLYIHYIHFIVFGLVYRYAVRKDQNPQLKAGVIGACKSYMCL